MRATISMVIALLVIAAPALAEERTAADVYREAREAYGQQDYEEAIRKLELANSLAPNPLYIYNVGRAQEALGRLTQAHATYLRVLGMPALEAEHKQLAEARIAALEPLLDVALVDLAAPLQIDARVYVPGAEPLRLPEGRVRVCASDAPTVLRCWWVDLRKGQRVELPPKRAAARATLRVGPIEGLRKMTLDEAPILLVDSAGLERIELDAGRVRVDVQLEAGPQTLEIDLVAGAEAALQDQLTPAPGPTPGPEAELQTEEGGGASALMWGLTISGVVVTGVGVGLLVESVSARSDLSEPQLGAGGRVVGLSQAQAQADWDAANERTVAGLALMGGGAGVLLGAMIVGLDAAKPEAAGQVQPVVGLGTIGARGRF